MVADPTHLVHGAEGPASADPAAATRAINIFRQAQPTGNGGTVLRSPNAGPGGGGGMSGSASGSSAMGGQ